MERPKAKQVTCKMCTFLSRIDVAEERKKRKLQNNHKIVICLKRKQTIIQFGNGDVMGRGAGWEGVRETGWFLNEDIFSIVGCVILLALWFGVEFGGRGETDSGRRRHFWKGH
jgi:hypothetical protein